MAQRNARFLRFVKAVGKYLSVWRDGPQVWTVLTNIRSWQLALRTATAAHRPAVNPLTRYLRLEPLRSECVSCTGPLPFAFIRQI